MRQSTRIRLYNALTAVKRAHQLLADAEFRMVAAQDDLRLAIEELDDDDNKPDIPEHIEDRRVVDDEARVEGTDDTAGDGDTEEV